MLTVLAQHVKGFSPGGHVPFILWTYVGLLAWGFFGGAIGGGTNSLVSNKALMAKSHFPRECFPMSQVLESAFSSLIALVPLGHPVRRRRLLAPGHASVWAPLYLAGRDPLHPRASCSSCRRSS